MKTHRAFEISDIAQIMAPNGSLVSIFSMLCLMTNALTLPLNKLFVFLIHKCVMLDLLKV